MNEKQLKQFDKATDKLAEAFVKKYFDKPSDVYWVGNDEDREVLIVNDYFFSLNRIVEAIRYDATEEQLFDYYDLEVEAGEKGLKVNFRNYIKQNDISLKKME